MARALREVPESSPLTRVVLPESAAVLEALCATTKLPEGESWLNRSMNFLARQRGSSKNLWDFQEGSAAR